jgi:hypothetical protein
VQNGDYFKVSDGDAGTVDSVVFAEGVRIDALVDGASTTTYAANWYLDAKVAALATLEDDITALEDLGPLKTYGTADLLFADNVLAYSAGAGKLVVAAGQYVAAGGFRFIVLASDASDQTVTTAGSVKLKYILGQNGYDVRAFPGANLGLKIQAAHDAMPDPDGGIINALGVQGDQVFTADLDLTIRCKVLLGAYEIDLADNRIICAESGVMILGSGRRNENNSTTRIKYNGTSSTAAITIVKGGEGGSVPIFGCQVKDLEIIAYGSAIASANTSGIRNLGGRYCEYNNVLVYNFSTSDKGAFYFTSSGTGSDAFGSSNHLINCGVSTCKFGVRNDVAGGAQSTHGTIDGGFYFGTQSGFYSESESWRVIGADLGGAIACHLDGAADDTVLLGPRFEGGSGIAIQKKAGLKRVYIMAPNYIAWTGTKLNDLNQQSPATQAVSITNDDTVPSTLNRVRAQVFYSDAGTTGTLANGGTEGVADLEAGGVWLATARQSTGGTAWRSAAIVWSNGTALEIIDLGSTNMTFTDNGSGVLRITNTNASTQAIKWSILKLDGGSFFSPA